MARLGSLPSELLLLIYCAPSSTLQSAARLAATNRRLYQVWLENLDSIVETILVTRIPEYGHAFALATFESTLGDGDADMSLNTHGGQGGNDSRVPPSEWVPRIIENSRRATATCEEFVRYFRDEPEDYSWHKSTSTSLPASYYMVRQLVHSYFHREQLPGLRSALDESSLDALRTHSWLGDFMCELMCDSAQAREGIPKDWKDWVPTDELYACVNKDEWEFATDVLEEMVNRRAG